MGACNVILIITSEQAGEARRIHAHVEHRRGRRGDAEEQEHGADPLGGLGHYNTKVLGEIRNDQPETEPVCQDGVEPVMLLERRRQKHPSQQVQHANSLGCIRRTCLSSCPRMPGGRFLGQSAGEWWWWWWRDGGSLTKAGCYSPQPRDPLMGRGAGRDPCPSSR